jgi:hypothetical protein
MYDLAKAYSHHGRVAEAIKLFNDELALRQAKVGRRYADVVALHEEMLARKKPSPASTIPGRFGA